MVEKAEDMGDTKVAFLGLGAMGLGMATSLLRAGFKVNGFDVSTPSACFMCYMFLCSIYIWKWIP